MTKNAVYSRYLSLSMTETVSFRGIIAISRMFQMFQIKKIFKKMKPLDSVRKYQNIHDETKVSHIANI